MRPPNWRGSSEASCPYTDDPMSMITPRVDRLLGHTDTHYAAVLVAAKRARQINAYYHSLSEGAYGEYTPPMVEVPSGNYLTIALEETAAGKLKYEYKG
jgi:DNA-directed RNA polymerase subunit omega